MTPLHLLTSCYCNLGFFPSSPRPVLEILIEAGADVHLENEDMVSPYNATLQEASAYIAERPENNTNDETTARHLEALAVMREWPASMKINGLVRGFLARRRLAAVTRR